MRLTLTLWKRKMPNGCIWTGKHRMAHHIYPVNIERMVKRLQVEENNMLLLRHPYITVEQESKVGSLFGKHEKWMQNKKLEKAASRTYPSVRIEDQFKKLLKTEQWDL